MPRGRSGATREAAHAAARGRAGSRPRVPFTYKLMLNQWLLGLFRVERFDQLDEHLRDQNIEGLDHKIAARP